MTESDGEKLNRLIAAVARGHADCLDGIYELIGGKMFAVALSLVRDRSAAEDILHDAFLKIARFAGKYRNDGYPAAWCLKIVRNTALDYLRKRKVTPTVQLDGIYTLTSADYSPEKRENAIMLEQALGKLNEEERRAIFYTYYLDMTVRETAAEMKISKSGAARLIARAEENLKKLLSQGTNGKDNSFKE